MRQIFSRWQKFLDHSHSHWRCMAMLAVAAVLAYIRTFENGFFYLDDKNFITDNPLVTGTAAGGIFSAFAPSSHADLLLYMPLTIVSWKFSWLMSGGSAAWFHATDLLLHIANASMLFWIVDRLTGRRTAAFLAALLFVVHPLNAEAVVWATQRKDLLVALFALLSFVAYIRHLEDSDRRMWLLVSVSAFVLGLLCKISIAPLPILLALFDAVARRERPTQWMLEKLWYLVPAALVVFIGLQSGATVLTPADLQLLPFLGAKSIAVLLGLFFFPLTQSALRWEEGNVALFDVDILLSLATVAGLVVATLLFWRKRSRYSLAAFGIAWFLLFLIPTFPSATKLGMLYYTSEKYAYLPMAGLLLALVVLATDLLDRHGVRMPKLGNIVGAIGVLIAVLFLGKTYSYVPAWQSLETYSQHVLQSEPENPYALANLGVMAEQQRDLSTAKVYYERALAADLTNAASYINIASLAFQQGNEAEMLRYFRMMESALTERQMRGDIRLRRLIAAVARDLLASRDPGLAVSLVQKTDALAPGDSEVRAALSAIKGQINSGT